MQVYFAYKYHISSNCVDQKVLMQSQLIRNW